MADDDSISNLPDDLLRRILHFAPAKDAASTSLLARRWRFLWRSSGAVNLDSRTYDHLRRAIRHDVVLLDAQEALAAASGPLTRFTFRYEESEEDYDPSSPLGSSFHEDDVMDAKADMARELEYLLCTPTTRQLEDLRLGLFYGMCDDSPTWLYDLSIRDLPCSGSLRVLHVSKCMDFERLSHLNSPPPPTPPFPRLVELRLHVCSVSLSILQGVIDAAPLLATLHLVGVQPALSNPTPDIVLARSIHLRCPKVTNLVLANMYCWGPQCDNTLDVEAPLLRCFTYEGPIRTLSLKPSPPDMARVDLRFHVPAQVHNPTDGTCQLFWKFIRNLSDANTINLDFKLSDSTCVGDTCC